jgi:hypothetical protein
MNTHTYKHKIRSYVKCFSLPVITTNLTQTLPTSTPLFDKAVMWVSPLTLHTVHVAKHYSCLYQYYQTDTPINQNLDPLPSGP